MTDEIHPPTFRLNPEWAEISIQSMRADNKDYIELLIEGACLDLEHICPLQCSYCNWVESVNQKLGTDH